MCLLLLSKYCSIQHDLWYFFHFQLGRFVFRPIPKHVLDVQLLEELCWHCWIFLWVIKFLELNFCWHYFKLNWWLLINEMSDSWKFRALDSYPGGHWFDSQGCKYENQKGYIGNWISSESLGKGLICVLVPNVNKTNIWINPDVMIFSFCKYDGGTFVHCPQFQFLTVQPGGDILIFISIGGRIN